MPEMHLKQPGFTYSVCVPFTKNKQRIKKSIQTRNIDFIYKNQLDNACFQHDMAYGKAKDFVRRTQSDKVLRDKAFKIASDPKYNGYQRGLASMIYKFFDKKSSRVVLLMNQNISWQMNFISLLLKNLKKEKYIHPSKTIFWG